MKPQDKLEAMIFRAIPRDPKCAIQENYNKVRRRWLKEQIELYIGEQLSQQFNAKPPNEGPPGVGAAGLRSLNL